MREVKLQTAFSMLELIFVIVILGIVASIGSEVIAQIYEGYIVQRAQYRASIKTELALNQIANRLRYILPETIVVRATIGATAYPLSGISTTDDKVLQWVAYDGDSFESLSSEASSGNARRPGWSGFCDIDAYTPGSTSLPTPGSNLDFTKTIIKNLGGDIANAMIYFRAEDNPSYGISDGSSENITLDNAIPSKKRIYERYKLAWTSYAVEVDDNSDLILHYSFAPIIGTNINGKSSILLKNVTNFRFKSSGSSLRIKICKEEQIGTNSTDTIHACKEKVIF